MTTSELPLLPYQQSTRPVGLVYATFLDLLKGKTKEAPEREFLIFPETDRRYTYREFYELAVASAEWLSPRAQPGGTICIVFRNTPEFLAVFFGAVAHGITVVPVNPDLATPEMKFIIENSNSRSVFYDPGLAAKIAPLEAAMNPRVAYFPVADVAEIPKVDVAAVEGRLPKV